MTPSVGNRVVGVGSHRVVNKVVTPAWKKQARSSWMRRFVPFVFAVVMMGATAAVASAQAVTSVEVTVWRQGATAPSIAPTNIALTQWSCNLPATPPPTGTVVNPTQLRIPDPANQNVDCLLNNPEVNALLSQLGYDPVNVYYAKARYRNSVGLGPESPNSNFFSQPGTSPTVAPASLRWGRGQ